VSWRGRASTESETFNRRAVSLFAGPAAADWFPEVHTASLSILTRGMPRGEPVPWGAGLLASICAGSVQTVPTPGLGNYVNSALGNNEEFHSSPSSRHRDRGRRAQDMLRDQVAGTAGKAGQETSVSRGLRSGGYPFARSQVSRARVTMSPCGRPVSAL
jgi:hypothetical protein